MGRAYTPGGSGKEYDMYYMWNNDVLGRRSGEVMGRDREASKEVTVRDLGDSSSGDDASNLPRQPWRSVCAALHHRVRSPCPRLAPSTVSTVVAVRPAATAGVAGGGLRAVHQEGS